MTDLKLGKDLTPELTDEKDWATVDQDDEFEQWVRLESKERLFSVLSEFNNEDVPHKIKLELNRIARDSDFISDLNHISVERTGQEDAEETGYRVNVSYGRSQEYSVLLEDL